MTTNDINASASLSFLGGQSYSNVIQEIHLPGICFINQTGTGIAIHGLSSRGVADYLINGTPYNSSDLGDQALKDNVIFHYKELPLDNYNLTITNIDTSEGNNYTLTRFVVFDASAADGKPHTIKKTYIIVGAVLGSFVLLVALYWCVWCMRRRRSQRNRVYALPSRRKERKASVHSLGSITLRGTCALFLPSIDERC